MPIIDDFAKYTIPEEIDSRIPEYFYPAMAGELCSIYGSEILQQIGDYFDMDSSTRGWYEAFKMTCKKLNMDWLLDYWNSLEWYDSDIFDGIIEDRIIEKFINVKDQNCNVYYNYLVNKGEKG